MRKYKYKFGEVLSRAENDGTRLVTRAATIKTMNKEARTMLVTAASETPANVFDWETGDMVREVLVADGFRLPAKGARIPFLDAHNRNSIMAVLGSASGFAAESNGNVAASVSFADTPEALRAMGLYDGGHLTDVSVGYTVDKSEMIEEGKTKKYKGREFTGPMRLVTAWTIKELSSVPIGADPAAKARAETKKQEEPSMKFHAWLSARGLDPKALTEQELAQYQSEFEAEQRAVKPAPTVQAPVAQAPVAQAPTGLTEADVARAEQETATRIQQIELAGRGLGLSQEIIDSVKFTAKTEVEASRAFIKALAKQAPPAALDIRITADDATKFREAASDALLMRAGITVRQPAPGAAQLSRLNFEGIARECLRKMGVDTSMKNKEDVLRMAHQMSRRSAFPGLDAVDFSNILSSSANKAVLAGYAQQPTTYQAWCKIANIPDFKSNPRVRLSDAGLLEQITAQGELKRSSLSESVEAYRIYTYGKIIGITREMQINDDLNVFQDMFMAFGLSAARTANGLPYAVLAANAALSDSVALFHATHGNLAAAGANPGSTTVSAGRAAMRKQTGPNGMKLNVQPAFIIVGPDNEDNAKIVIASTTLPLADMAQGVMNPNQNTVSVIVDAEITGNAWYLASNPIIEPTLEMGFLNGNSNPTLETRPVGGDILGTDFWAYLDMGCKAVGYRGLYKNPGA